MKKQDNESLIQELTKRLDWYMMEASDDEFDAEQVQALMKLLDSLKEEEDQTEEEMPVEEALNDFWKYCEEREEEEKVLYGAEESRESDSTSFHSETKEGHREGKFRSILWFFHRHRLAVVTAVVLAVIVLGGSWQVAANAEKHGGFFWWMDKSEDGTTMITAPEGADETDGLSVERYYDIEEIPEKYREYIEQISDITLMSEYEFDYAKIMKGVHKDTVYIFMKNIDNTIRFQVIVYPQKILRVRESYPGYIFEREFENEGVTFDVLSKNEITGENTFLIYFYNENEKYIVIASMEEEKVQDIAIEYKNEILNY